MLSCSAAAGRPLRSDCVQTKSPSSLLRSRRLHDLLNSERIHRCALELPSRNFALKQNVKLRIATTLGLWQAEKCPRKTQERSAGPEEACFGLPIPVGWVQHVRRDHAVDDALTIVQAAGQHNGLRAQTARRNLSDYRVRYRPNTNVVAQCEEQQERAAPVRRSLALG